MLESRRSPLRRMLAPSLLAATAALLLAGGATRLAAPAHAAPAADAAAISVSVSDDTVTIPTTLAPGFETLTISNTGAMPHSLSLFRANDGVTIDQVLAAGQQVTDDPATQMAFYALVTSYAGADTLDPGSSQTLTEQFSDGSYVAVDTSGMAPLFATFDVTGDPTTATAPTADWQVTEKDFSFDAPTTVPAGATTVQVTNAGAQMHMMVLVRLDTDKTVQDVIDYLMSAGPDSPQPDWVHNVPGMPDLSPSLSAYTELNLDPGTYVMLCFDTDPDTGLPHVAEGMIGSFTAQ
jgi:hypothetical protein